MSKKDNGFPIGSEENPLTLDNVLSVWRTALTLQEASNMLGIGYRTLYDLVGKIDPDTGCVPKWSKFPNSFKKTPTKTAKIFIPLQDIQSYAMGAVNTSFVINHLPELEVVYDVRIDDIKNT